MVAPSTLDVDPAVLLGQLALRLAAPSPLPGALELLVAGLGLRSAALRLAGSPLVVAGDAGAAVPAARGDALPPAVVDVPVPGDAVLTVVGARPEHLPALRAAAAVLGLALAFPPAAAAVVLDADATGDLLADELHDGPVQALVAARYACDSALRGGDATLARDAVQEALVGLRQTMWHLRSRAALPLPEALAALSARLVEAGDPPLDLLLDTGVDLAPAVRALVHRLVQTVSRGAVVPVRVVLRAEGDRVLLDVDGGHALDDPGPWLRRLQALGGAAAPTATGLRVHLPVTGSPVLLDPSTVKARS